MPPDPTQPQNPVPAENPLPQSPQEPTEPAPIPPLESIPPELPPGLPEGSGEGFEVKSTNIPISNQAENTAPAGEAGNQDQTAQPVEPEETPEPETAQTPVNEPLEELEIPNEQAKPVSVNSKPSLARELLIQARNAIQFRKRKKLDKVMSLFLQQSKITNDEVEKYLHVSDATATRYLSQLEKEGRIQQSGKTGAGVSYSRI